MPKGGCSSELVAKMGWGGINHVMMGAVMKALVHRGQVSHAKERRMVVAAASGGERRREMNRRTIPQRVAA